MEDERGATTWWEALTRLAEWLIQPVVGMLINASEVPDPRSGQ